MLIDGESLTIEDVYKVACLKERVELDETVKNKVKRSRKIVEEYAKEEKVAYGITTGLGELCNVFRSDRSVAKESYKKSFYVCWRLSR